MLFIAMFHSLFANANNHLYKATSALYNYCMVTSTSEYTETLDIENFLSIKKFYWVIKPFNIITGDMASGKSLCMKLLYFFEDIFISSIIVSPIFSRKLFENGTFFDRISKKFKNYFFLDNDNSYQNLHITYSFKINDSNFTISVTGDNNSKNKLVWESDYLNDQLSRWADYFINPERLGMAQEVRIRIHEEISHHFSNKFPIATMFVPATRAASIVGENASMIDDFLKDFIDDKNFLLSYPDISLSKKLADILHVNNIKKNPKNEGHALLIHSDGKTVPPLFSSSGQQELVYLLLLMEKLPEITFLYGKIASLFIEEPSAHLFPDEQKNLIESIVALFQQNKALETRFFISTHSPYVLNVINNMLKKGYLIDKANNCPDENKKKLMKEEIEKLGFPHLSINEISAHFIKDEVTSMINESENGAYLYEEIMEDITRKINYDYKQVRDLLSRYKD